VKNILKNRVFVIIFFIILSFIIYLLINHLKNSEIDRYKKDTYREKVLESKVYLHTLIKEKQNATSTIALGLSRNSDIIAALKDVQLNTNLLKEYSKQLKINTDFKNVWFQLVTKDGVSIQRSWTEYKNDKIAMARSDLKETLKEKKILNTISVGKFDMSFKSIVPVFDDNETFLGLVEVITHFNSIAKKLEEKKINTIALADKRFKKQLTHAFSKTFIDDYYVANLDARKYLVHYLQDYGIDKYLKNLTIDDFYIDNDLKSVVSYYRVSDDLTNSVIGHILLIQSIDKIDISKISYIQYIHNIYLLFSIIILILVFYFFNNIEIKNIEGKSYSLRIFLTILVIYFILAFSIYQLIKMKYNGDIESYKQTVIQQTLLEYNSIVQKNKDISEFIFLELLNKPDIIKAFKNKDREKLYALLLNKYKSLAIKYNLRQLHFHLPDSTSFLRMHKPKIYGDSLVGIRQSVEYVNNSLKPFYGFEEGRIYNGFRYVFPLFDEKNNHMGSVETSFDIKSFIDNYMNLFETKRVNFLISKKIIDEKVFKDQQSNYSKSPVEGYYFDKSIVKKLEASMAKTLQNKAKKEVFDTIAKKIKQGSQFSVHFSDVDELTVIIPIINKISGEIVGALNVSKSDRFIKNRLQEFNQLIMIILIVLGFMIFFVYREYLSKIKAKVESQNNQKILDSQNSFIVITDGVKIKRVNNTFLEFFGYESLGKFQNDYSCICDFFLDEKGKGYLLKEINGLNWFEYMKENLDKNIQVKMDDKNHQSHIFYIDFDISNRIYDNNYIVTFVDITHLKNVENQLLSSEKMASLGNMIGNIAHQWRQPLSVISTAASGVHMKQQYGLLQDGDIEKNMDYIVENTKYLSETIDTFRDFVKENDSKELTKSNINEIIESVLKIMEATLKNNYIKIVFNSTKNIQKTMVKGEFIQVITNLINNAKDVLKERKVKEPKITIELTEQKNNIVITLEDNGGGIDETIIDKIFEPYFTTKHKSMGTGLGLYICHKIIIESFDGDISVKNSQDGAIFTITLPQDIKNTNIDLKQS
jgi:signal transduction histidine kinase